MVGSRNRAIAQKRGK